MTAFISTLWPLIEEAKNENSDALQEFVQKYHAPVVAFIERAGQQHQAEDLAQEVFIEIIRDRILEKADPRKGRFRSLILAITKHIISRDRRRQQAKKRGSGRVVPLGDFEVPTPEEDEDFTRVWTEYLTHEALHQLSESDPDYHQAVQMFFFEETPYQDIVEATEKSMSWVKNSIYRGKLKLAAIIRELVSEYSSSNEEFEHEMSQFKRFYSV